MGQKRVLVCYGVDIDAVAGWLGSYKGEDSTSDVSRGKVPILHVYYHTFTKLIRFISGLWAGTVGVERLLKLFEKYKITATWFIPGTL
jgi:peptidoglycan/xylan/chitin deacetylase (PgdA/CDA1 family)